MNIMGEVYDDRVEIVNPVMLQGKLSKKTVEYNMEKLKEKGIINRIGPDKGGHWEIVNV